MSLPPGYDAWRTREPVERRYEAEWIWRVTGYNPHVDKPVDLGECSSEVDAQCVGKNWLWAMEKLDPEYAGDYWYDIHAHDLLEDCICWGKLDRNCPLHGIDPDQARDERLDR